MISSHTSNILNQWTVDGFINMEQYDAIVQLIEVAAQNAYDDGLSHSENDGGYDDGYRDGMDYGYEQGYSEGESSAKLEWESQRDEWFEQGWAEALLEHGIEE